MSLSSRTSTWNSPPSFFTRSMSPMRTSRAGLAVTSPDSIRPSSQARAACVHVLKNRAAQSHLSILTGVASPQLVSDVGETPAVGRPGVDVHRPLSSEELDEVADVPPLRVHRTQHHVLVGRVPLGPLVERHEDDLPAVGRWMRKPVLALVAGDALRFGIARTRAPGGDAPDVPASRPVGVEVDPLAVGRVVRSVIVAGMRGEPLLFPA